MKLKYELEEGAVNFILAALNEMPVKGIKQANDLLVINNLLRNPINKSEFDKFTAEKITGQKMPPELPPTPAVMKVMEKLKNNTK